MKEEMNELHEYGSYLEIKDEDLLPDPVQTITDAKKLLTEQLAYTLMELGSFKEEEIPDGLKLSWNIKVALPIKGEKE